MELKTVTGVTGTHFTMEIDDEGYVVVKAGGILRVIDSDSTTDYLQVFPVGDGRSMWVNLSDTLTENIFYGQREDAAATLEIADIPSES